MEKAYFSVVKSSMKLSSCLHVDSVDGHLKIIIYFWTGIQFWQLLRNFRKYFWFLVREEI